MPLLEVRDLSVEYRLGSRTVRAAEKVSFGIEEGEFFGLVGESGCGKSTVAKAILRLLPPVARVTEGQIFLRGRDLLGLSEREMRKVRWKEISLITQSALNALDPVLNVGKQVEDAIRLHEDVSPRQADERVVRLFEMVGLPPDRRKDFPHQFSGGMRQRVIIAMAFALSPPLVLADEATTALDVVMQNQILAKVRDLHRDLHHAMLMITHDISLIAENCRRVAVMYAGRIAELAGTSALFREPAHPYTLGLQNAFPSVQGPKKRLIAIPGSPPSLEEPIRGCAFAPRCPFSTDRCFEEVPPLKAWRRDHLVACHYADWAEEFRERAGRAETWRLEERPLP